MFSFFLAAVIIVSASFPALAQAEPFRKGEVIRFAVKQSGIKAGEATLTFAGETYREGKKYALIIFSARGLSFFDEEMIFVDTKTLLPQLVVRDLNIFGSKENIMEEYDQAAGLIRITKVVQGRTTVQEIRKKGPIDNIYGFIYRYRREGRFAVGERFDLRLPTLDVVISQVQDVKFNAMGGSYDAVLMRSVPSKYSIWMDKGARHLPLRIAGAIGIANTVMTIIDHKE